ncbi:MAG: tetratricopeptide repeat protein [Bacteroidota bacterium]
MSSPKKAKKKPASKKKKAPQAPDWFYSVRTWKLIILAFSFVLYGNTLFNGYAQDDAIVITDNAFTKQGLAGWGKILSEDTFVGFFGVKKDLVSGGRYRPFSLLTFALEYQLFGANPFVSHLINILLYALTGIVLFLLLLKLLKPRFANDLFGLAFLSGVSTLIFLAMPVHTEVVANIKGRDEIFSLLGSLAAFYYLLKAMGPAGVQTGTLDANLNGNGANNPMLNLSLSGLFFFMALLSKENAITFLAIIPVGLVLLQGRAIGAVLGKMLPIFAATIVFILIRASILGWSLGDPPQELMNNPYLKLVGNVYVPFTFSEKLATITFTMGKYLQLMIAPLVLTHDYYPKHIDVMSWTDWRVLLGLVAYLLIIGFALLRFRKFPIIAWSVLVYIAALSIVSNIVFPVGVHMSERFIYMPSVGFALAMAALLYRFAQRLNGERPQLKALVLPMGVLGIFLLAFTAKTVHRNLAWQNNYSLFLTDIKTSVNSAKLQNAVGGEIIQESLRLRNEKLRLLPKGASQAQIDPIEATFKSEVETAVPHLLKAIELHPSFASPYLLLGNAFNYLDRHEESVQYYNQALVYKNPYPEATQNMGKTYLDGGRFFGEKQQNFQKALQWLNQAEAFETNDQTEIKRLKALCFASLGDLAKAIPLLEAVIKVAPTKSSLTNLASMYQNTGNVDRANQLRAQAAQAAE